ncbi:MAG: hypothetical protein ABI852_21100, partial [Gemmatimonadaceae bacterium]
VTGPSGGEAENGMLCYSCGVFWQKREVGALRARRLHIIKWCRPASGGKVWAEPLMRLLWGRYGACVRDATQVFL